ncbi:MAG: hypothetical protein J5509_00240 [Lachnospiraceae bacterium]|nr:hypothetical protein [Lachnospiraceae bacterium]
MESIDILTHILGSLFYLTHEQRMGMMVRKEKTSCIDDTDVFGVGDRDPIYRVFGAKDRINNKDIRIDMQNYGAWDILNK